MWPKPACGSHLQMKHARQADRPTVTTLWMEVMKSLEIVTAYAQPRVEGEHALYAKAAHFSFPFLIPQPLPAPLTKPCGLTSLLHY